MSKMQQELNKLMATRAKIERAIIAEAAVSWLQQYGPTSPPERDTILANVSIAFAASCPGVKDAKAYLEEAIQRRFDAICTVAIELAREDIKAAETAIGGNT